jgi:hypothetical protein
MEFYEQAALDARRPLGHNARVNPHFPLGTANSSYA